MASAVRAGSSARPVPMLRTAAIAVAVLATLARFLPTQPQFPTAGLDASWTWAINIADERGLAFGRDIIFTYGPYGAVATRMWDPALRGLILGGCAMLALAFLAGILMLAGRRPLLLLCMVVPLPLVQGTDALAYALPLPAMLQCARLQAGAALPAATLAAVLALLPALALLPLIKASFLAATLLTLALLMFLLWHAGHRALAVTLPCLTAVAMALLWLAAGQHLALLGAYALNASRIIGGYNDAMAVPGPFWVPLRAALWAALLLALLVWGGRGLKRAAAMPLAATVAVLLFVIIKAGTVRQDAQHEAICMSSIGLMFLLLAPWLQPRATLAALAAGLLVLGGAFGTPAQTLRATGDGWVENLRGAERLVAGQADLARAFAAHVAGVPGLPWHVPGTADIYSSGQARLFATGLAWAPRPVFQSYSAYTPALARLNLAHLLGPDAPDNVFFGVDPIDGRLPALEDGLSWPALLSRYNAQSYDARSALLWLRRAASPAPPATPGPPFLDTQATLGTPVSLPPAPDLLWARIDPRRSLAGTLAAFVLRAPNLAIRLTYPDGSSDHYRLVPGMARAGFLLAPVVTSTLDFALLRAARPPDGTPLRRRPASMALEAAPGGGWAWQTHYRLVLSPLALPPIAGPLAVTGMLVPRRVPAPSPAPARFCFLDQMDGGAPPRGTARADRPVTLSGWAVFDADAGLPADSLALGFQAAGGPFYEVDVLRGDRSDVAAVFHRPSLVPSGFATRTDLSTLPPGDYAVLAVANRAGVAHACATGLTLSTGARK